MLSPESTDYVTFGPGFSPRVLVLVDTEEDFDWGQPVSRANVSVKSIARLERAHKLFGQYGITPCYLIDYPIATTTQSIEVLKPWVDDGSCIIGSQLHPWVNPPFVEELSRTNSFAGNLPRQLEKAKLEALTHAIEASFNMRPRVYRAGRYGVGPNSVRTLTELGYSVDVSVRPYYDYGNEGGPNFRRILPQPYWADPERQLLELPLTSGFTGLLRGVGEGVYAAASRLGPMTALLSRSRLLNRVTLSPEGMPVEEVIPALKVMAEQGQRIFCISFHSPSLEPGNTPYVRNERDLEDLYAWLHEVLTFLIQTMGARPATPFDILAAAQAGECAAVAGG